MGKRRRPNPRNIKKASSILRRQAVRPATKIDPEDKEETKNGYRVPGINCKNFETFYECIIRHTETDKVAHAKKFRAYRVLGGEGLLFLYDEKDPKILKLSPGVEAEVPPETPYKISASHTDLEVYVVQGYKYEARMKVLEESVEVPDRLREARAKFEADTPMESMPRKKTGRRSKAAIQQAKLDAQRERASKKAEIARKNKNKTSERIGGDGKFDEANTVNPMPSMGNFSEETAG